MPRLPFAPVRARPAAAPAQDVAGRGRQDASDVRGAAGRHGRTRHRRLPGQRSRQRELKARYSRPVLDLSGRSAPPELGDATVLDRGRRPHRLVSCWERGPCVVVLLRHFGCIGCDVTVTELAPRLDEIHAAGARTLLVGNGEAAAIDGFVERHALADKPAVVLTDPTLAAFRAAGFIRSAWATFGPRAVVDY